MSSVDTKARAADDPVVYIKTRLTYQLFLSHCECYVMSSSYICLEILHICQSMLQFKQLKHARSSCEAKSKSRRGESVTPKQKSDLPEARQRLKERLKCKLSPFWLKRQSNISCFTWKPGWLRDNYSTHRCCWVFSTRHLSAGLLLFTLLSPRGNLLAAYC